MIAVDQLSYSVDMHGEVLNILSDISLRVDAGKSLAIVGASGSGKTTLLGLLSGLDVPTSGVVRVAGQCISTMSEDERAEFRANTVGIVFQSFHLLPALTAFENVVLPLELAKKSQGEEKAKALLEQVGLGHRLHHKPSELSGGEQQRVAIARAFAAEAKVLFADEPTGNLDYKTGEQIIHLLFELNKEHNTTLVMVTHDRELASRCDACVEIHDGRLQQEAQ